MKWLFRNGGHATLASYARTPEYDLSEVLTSIRDDFPEHLRLLNEASLIETLGQYGFVHAGIDPDVHISEQQLPDCIQIRGRFLDHVGTLSHIIVRGYTPVTPPRPVVTENRISLDTHAWDTGVLSLAIFDIERGSIELFSTNECGSVVPVEPVCIDRGLGTACKSLSDALSDDFWPETAVDTSSP